MSKFFEPEENKSIFETSQTQKVPDLADISVLFFLPAVTNFVGMKTKNNAGTSARIICGLAPVPSAQILSAPVLTSSSGLL